MTTSLPDLTELGNIPAEYQHITKLITPADGLALPDAYLKWYEVRRPEAEIPAELQADARAFLQSEAAAGRLDLRGELGFVIHHLCGQSFYFLIVCSWRNQNEMWETLYGQEMATGGGYQLVPQGTHLEVICVWELGAVLHEQQAWSRYLRSPRAEQDKRNYLEDRFTGTV